jgi:hemoglobin/transferrin/lactoferrin receptor protein
MHTSRYGSDGSLCRTLRLTALLMVAALCRVPMAAAQDGGRPERRGVAVDESGSAIGGAHYVIRNPHGVVLQDGIADANGTFTIQGLPAGSYWLEVAAPNFQTRRMSVDVAGTGAAPLRIVLGMAPLQSEVTVTAQRGMIADIEETPPVVTVREKEEFRGRPMPTLGNALEGAAGVMVQQSTYGQASPFLRGLTGYQVLNLIDGVRFNNSTFRSGPNQYLAFADPAQVQRIEAMLGPASSQFGSDALGGAIQVLTPSVLFGKRPGFAVSGEANLFGTSADVSSGADAMIFVRGRNLSWSAGGVGRRLDDLRAGGNRDSHHTLRRFFGLSDEQIQGVVGGRQQDTGFTQSGLHTKLATRLGSEQSLTLWYQRSNQSDVRGYKDLWGGLGRLRSDFDPQRLDFFYTRYQRLGVGRLDWVSSTFSINSQRDGSVRQGLRPADRIVQDDVSARAMGYAAQAGAHMGRRHTVVFGGEIYDESIDARRNETDPLTGATQQKRALYPNGSEYRTSGIFAQDVLELVRGDEGPRLSAQLGGRFTHVHVAMDADSNRTAAGQSLGVVDSSRSYHDWTFNTGLTWNVTRVLSLNALVGRGFRAPNLNDLGALGLNDLGYEVPAGSTIASGALIGASDGEGVLSTGRPVDSLESERLFNYELGTTVRWRRFYGRVQGFDAELRDPIVRRTLLFPIDRQPSTLDGAPVSMVTPTAAQRQQGVVSVATSLDPRAVKAFVNEGRARYYGLDTLFRSQLTARWSAEGSYSYLAGHDLDPERPVRRLPPQQGSLAVRYHLGRWLSWIEASGYVSGAQELLSGGDLTDERIGAARRRADISDFFRGGLVSPFIVPGGDGVIGTADDLFAPTGETLAQIRDRVLPVGATINGVTILDDGTRVPLYTRTPAFVTANVRVGLTITGRLRATLAVMNLLDRNYRVHGSGVDAPGINVFAALNMSY